MTAAARLNYLTAYRLQRLGSFVLRDDAAAPLPVWAAQCAAETAHTPDPLSAPMTVRRGAHALARGLGLGIGRLRLTRFGYLPPDPIPPAAGPAALVLAGLPAPATAQAHPPAQPNPHPQDPSPELIPCDFCAGTGRVRDACDFCESCDGFGFTEVDLSEPDPSIAKTLALSLADCLQAIDAFYHCQVSGAADLHAALKLSAQRARKTLIDTGYPLSRWPF